MNAHGASLGGLSTSPGTQAELQRAGDARAKASAAAQHAKVAADTARDAKQAAAADLRAARNALSGLDRMVRCSLSLPLYQVFGGVSLLLQLALAEVSAGVDLDGGHQCWTTSWSNMWIVAASLNRRAMCRSQAQDS